MKFFTFKKKVNEIVKKAGLPLDAEFAEEDGKYIASFPDNTKIIGALDAKYDKNGKISVAVQWGSGHQAMALV